MSNSNIDYELSEQIFIALLASNKKKLKNEDIAELASTAIRASSIFIESFGELSDLIDEEEKNKNKVYQ